MSMMMMAMNRKGAGGLIFPIQPRSLIERWLEVQISEFASLHFNP
jgi:hypothetical protein